MLQQFYMKILILSVLLSFVFTAPTVNMRKKSKDEIQKELSNHFYEYTIKLSKRLEKEKDLNVDGVPPEQLPGKVAEYLASHPDVSRDLDEIKLKESHLLTDLYKTMHKENLTEEERDKLLYSIASKETFLHVNNPGKFSPDDINLLFNIINEHMRMEDEEEAKIYHMQRIRRRIQELKDIATGTHSKSYFKKIHEEHKELVRSRHQNYKPGSIDHIRHIWTDVDELLSEFNPKIFFKLHDLNADGVWDPLEVEAIIDKDMRRIGMANKEDRYHQEVRSRQTVMKAVDGNSDGLISEEEFLKYYENLDKHFSPKEELDDEDYDYGEFGEPGDPEFDKIQKALDDLKPDASEPEAQAEWDLAHEELEKADQIRKNPQAATQDQKPGDL